MIRPRFDLAIVIINYRTPDITVDCLQSLAGEVAAIGDAGVIVVDNASGDGSADQIAAAIAERGWGDWVRLIRSGKNLGFSGGNNLGIESAEAESYLLLNSDTIVRPGAVVELHRVLGERPEVGMVSPRLEWPDGTPQENCFRFLKPASELIRAASTGPVDKLLKASVPAIPVSDDPQEPPWTSFAGILIRRRVFEQIGLLDEGYFMYFDDVDFCRRARRAGVQILHWPRARIVHLRGKSGPVKAATASRQRRPAYFYESRSRYYAKFYGRPGLWLANACWIAGRALSLARELVGHKSPHTCRREGLDIWTNWVDPLGERRNGASGP